MKRRVKRTRVLTNPGGGTSVSNSRFDEPMGEHEGEQLGLAPRSINWDSPPDKKSGWS